ncbi:MAG: hypothetical protein K6F52_05455 [Clostridia bacterium]|nr:hypothetical protein [Clostridia bacterium]
MERLRIRSELEDREYGEALSEAVAAACKEICFVGEGEKTDIVLLEPGKSAEGETFAVYMTESAEEKAKLRKENLCAAEKYEPVSEIAQTLILAGTEHLGRSFRNRVAEPAFEKREIFGFFSSSGGVGTSSIALGSAQYLRRFEGKHPLFLSLEYFPSVPCFIADSENESIRDIENYVYRWRKGEKAAENPELFMVRDIFGVCAFRTGKGINPLALMSREEIVEFIHITAIKEEFDSIVIDFGTTVSEAALELMNCCGSLCFVTSQRDNEKRGECCFAYLKANETDIRNTERIINRCTVQNAESEPEENECNYTETRIPEDPESFRKLMPDEKITPIDIDGIFGTGIKEFLCGRVKNGDDSADL